MILASIDIGTNTVLMLIAEVKGNDIYKIDDLHFLPRIGKGVKKGQNISEEKIEELLKILRHFNTVIKRYKCESVICTATNAFRLAGNSLEVVDKVYKETGIKINVVTGETEANYSYWGQYGEGIFRII